LTSFESIQHFVQDFNRTEPRLDILVNNAGVMLYPQYEKTVDGWETVFQSNLGHFLLTELLLPKLEESPIGGRVVNVSSLVQRFADTVDLDVCNSRRHFDRWMKTYARSKLAQIMHAVALTKKIRDRNPASKVVINSCHPGTVDTNLPRTMPLFKRFLKPVFGPLIWFILKTDNDGAQTSLYLALSKQTGAVSGKYFSDCKEQQKNVNPLATIPEKCEELYNASLEACGLAEE